MDIKKAYCIIRNDYASDGDYAEDWRVDVDTVVGISLDIDTAKKAAIAKSKEYFAAIEECVKVASEDPEYRGFSDEMAEKYKEFCDSTIIYHEIDTGWRVDSYLSDSEWVTSIRLEGPRDGQTAFCGFKIVETELI